MKDIIRAHIESNIETKRKIIETLLPEIEKAARVVIEAVKNGNKVLFFGNGGSAADAQHLAAEFVGRYERERRALPAIALTTDTSILTALANDYSYDIVFKRQVEALGRPGDVAFGITTSGNSKSVILALEQAKAGGLKTIAFLGRDGGKLRGKADVEIIIPSQVTSRIQESHLMIGHILCDLVDRTLF